MKSAVIYAVLIFSLIVGFIAVLFTGNIHIPLKDIVKILFTGDHPTVEWVTIVREIRVPKAITAVMAGVALSVSGLQMQTIFRNPLAGPYVLGISSGASLGVAIMTMGLSSIAWKNGIAGNWMIVLAAISGAAVVLFLIFSVSIRMKDIMTILILGILFGSITSSLISALQYFSNAVQLKSFTVWMMGSLTGVTVMQLKVLVPCVLSGVLLSICCIKSLNAMLLGENYARSLGIRIITFRLLVFLSTGILAGSITAFCGPVGFIGIVVPHVGRMLFNTADQRTLLASCLLIGPIVVLASDLISQLPGNGVILPLNTVTAFIGIPVIIWIIFKNQKMSSFV